jgi:hypothetical protein
MPDHTKSDDGATVKNEVDVEVKREAVSEEILSRLPDTSGNSVNTTETIDGEEGDATGLRRSERLLRKRLEYKSNPQNQR